MSGEIIVDTSAFPLVVVRFVGVYTDAQFATYLAELDALLARPGKRTLILDASDCGPVQALHRRQQAEWLRRNEAEVARKVAGLAFVLPSALLRGVLTAVFWMQPAPCPHEVVATLEDAKTVARRWLGAA